MKTYRVRAKCTSYCYLDIEADDPQSAYYIAMDADGGEFTPEHDGDWELEKPFEI